MEEETTLNKKQLVVFSLIVISVVIAWFLFNYSWLTINSSSDGLKLVKISAENDSTIDEFELENESKTLFLRRGTYKVEAIEGDKFSAYKKPLGFLWFNQLDIELSPQKSSTFLGKSPLPCAKEKSSEVLFSSCVPYTNDGVVVSSKRGFLEQKSKHSGITDNEYVTVGGTLLNYREGYLSAKVVNEDLLVSTRETGEENYSNVSGFKGTVDENTFSVSKDSENFVLLDSESGQILNFKNPSDSNPSRIPLPGDKADYSYFNAKVLATKDHIYFFRFEGDHHEQEEKPPAEQSMFVYSTASNELEKEYAFPQEWQIGRTVPGPNNQILLVINNFSENSENTYLIKGLEGPLFLDTLASTPQSACWKDGESFYYLADSGQSIYLYSQTKQASSLVYGGLGGQKIISDIQCNSGVLYFVFDYTLERQRVEPDRQGYYHYRLSDSGFTGIRPESLVPLFVPVGADVVKADMTPRGIEISVEFEEDNNPLTPSNKKAQEAVSREMEAQGVMVSGLDFYFKN